MNALPIVCFLISLVATNTAADETIKGWLKLFGSPHEWQGNVFHKLNADPNDNRYLYLCDEGWNLKTANVICKELGFKGASFIYSGVKFAINKMQALGSLSNIWRCKTGREQTIKDCSETQFIRCNESNIAGVQCRHQKLSSNESSSPNCTFDKDTCGYKSNSSDGDILWQQMTGKILDNWKYRGKYMYLMQEGRGLGTKGQLRSPFFTKGNCSKFLYYLATNKGSLRVYLRTQKSYPKLLWSRQGTENSTNKWENARIPLGVSENKAQLIFEGEVGISFENVIAVDDITLFATAKPCTLFPDYAGPVPEQNQLKTPSCKQKTLRRKCCKFPFLYNGTIYNSCIQKEKIAWCAIEKRVVDVNRNGKFWDVCQNEEVQLAGGLGTSSGPVQVNHQGRWGYICGDSSWDKNDAEVVCRQLGFLGAKNSFIANKTNQNGLFWLQEVHCNGNEPLLSLCLHRGWGISSCPQNQLAAVACDKMNSATLEFNCKSVDDKNFKTAFLNHTKEKLNDDQVTIIVSEKTVYAHVNGMTQKQLNNKMADFELKGCKKKPSSPPQNQKSKKLQGQPSAQPQDQPSAQPQDQPSAQPQDQPSAQPQDQPSAQPQDQPSAQPQDQPSLSFSLRTLQYGGVLLLVVSAVLLCYCVRRKKPCVEGEPKTYTKVPTSVDDDAELGNQQESDILLRKKEKKLNKLASKNC